MDTTKSYWFAMLVASALGTNLGDLFADALFSNRMVSLACLLAMCVASVLFDRRAAGWTEAGYWTAIIAMRAAATNLADMLTHDFAMGYAVLSALLCVTTIAAARFTIPDAMHGGSPKINGAYWIVMFIAGLFGTVAGDCADHAIGLYAGAVVFCLTLMGLILLRHRWGAGSMLLYWLIIMVERCAGTAVGDSLASRRAIGLGLTTASICTATLLVAALGLRAALLHRRHYASSPA